MIKRGKKAQGVFGISFGMLFSIIIIIAIIGVSFYAITYFLGLNKCAEAGLFYENLQDQIDRAWTSGTYFQPYDGSPLPKGIESVCFGELTSANSPGAPEYFSLYNQFKAEDSVEGANIFLHPIEKACDGDLFSHKLEHVRFTRFFCSNITLYKKPDVFIKFVDTQDNLVRIETTS